MRKIIISLWFVVYNLLPLVYAQNETLTLLTYYPAPYGVYRELKVTATTSGDAILTVEADTDNNNGNDNPQISFLQDGGLVNAFIAMEGRDGMRSTGTIGNAFVIGSEDDDPSLQFVTNDNVRMTILTDGKVGIGTISPDSDRLDIVTTVNSLTAGVANIPLRIRKNSNNNNEGVGIGFTCSDGDSQIGAKIVHNRIGSNSRGDLRFYTKPSDGGSGDTTTEKMRIEADGNVGIGGINPSAQLHIAGTSSSTTQLTLDGDFNQGPNTGTKLLIRNYDNDTERTILKAVDENDNTDLEIKSSLTNPTMFFRGKLWIGDDDFGEANKLRVLTTGGIAVYAKSTESYGLWAESEESAAIYTRTSNQFSSAVEAFNTNGGTAIEGTSTSVPGSGRGVSGTGNQYGIYGSSSNYAGYFRGKVTATDEKTRLSAPFDHTGHLYDIGELIPCAPDVEYSDVVVINLEKDREVIKCTGENQSAAGIISESPQFSFGDREKAREEEPERNWNFLALAGQVYVKADAGFGEIKRGDLLSTSPIPGHAMKAKPVEIRNGFPVYPQGCIVGKALEPLKEGKGKILVLVCLM